MKLDKLVLSKGLARNSGFSSIPFFQHSIFHKNSIIGKIICVVFCFVLLFFLSLCLSLFLGWNGFFLRLRFSKKINFISFYFSRKFWILLKTRLPALGLEKKKAAPNMIIEIVHTPLGENTGGPFIAL